MGGTWQLLGMCSLLLLGLPMTPARVRYATVYSVGDPPSIEVKDVLDKKGDAYGFYNDTVLSTGWSVLEVRAGYGAEQKSNEEIMFAAGYLEGYLTAADMHSHYANMIPQMVKKVTVTQSVKDFLKKQDQWTRMQIKKRKGDPMWRHASYITAQLDGLYTGASEWDRRVGKSILPFFAILFLNAMGDLIDLIPMLFPDSGDDWHSLSKEDARRYQWQMGHCSALIKVLPGYENILFAHSSWFTYAATLRVYKHWDFNLNDPDTNIGKMSFSSYPGLLESMDDFYIMGNGLIMMQTTNNVFNGTLFKYVVPGALLTWQRVRIANMMAKNGKSWAKIFSRYNSGTYSNQYMILDLKKVKLKKRIAAGALYITEQIPTRVEASDQTAILRQGYWASYNVPFHKSIYTLSGYPELVHTYGSDMTYDLAPRAKIFRRDQGTVRDLESLKSLMRYNNYEKEPYATLNPCNTICCREDLNPDLPIPSGCYDTKVSDFNLIASFSAYAISGPTVAGGLPPFSWAHFNQTVHEGLPETYNFKFMLMKPYL
ncbi:phospholipase-B 81-like [Ambystoma mexicanum]|uniref:phospholipase-B 81-like n=1 Tax=Ambystoma mexicanum TaxID=8296 RepID=UPI0037E7C719